MGSREGGRRQRKGRQGSGRVDAVLAEQLATSQLSRLTDPKAQPQTLPSNNARG